MSDERRKCTRVVFDGDCAVFDGTRSHGARLLDISIKGALIELPTASAFSLNAPCDVIIPLDSSGVEIKIRCHPVHRESDRLGLCFTRIDVESLTHLRSLIALNMGDADKTLEELFLWTGSDFTGESTN